LFLKYFSLGLVGQVKNDLFPIIKQSLLSNGSLDSAKSNRKNHRNRDKIAKLKGF
jgi:hypothetical protein